MTEQTILDMCCGSRMFWFDKQDARAVFSDIRAEQHTLCDGRSLVSIQTLSLTSARCRSLIPLSRLLCSTRLIWSVLVKMPGWVRNTVA